LWPTDKYWQRTTTLQFSVGSGLIDRVDLVGVGIRWALNVVSVLQRVLYTRNAFRPDWHHVVQEIHSQRQVISSISVCVLLRLVECQSCTVHLRTIDSTVQPLLYSVEQEAQLSQKGRAPTVSLKILLSYSSEIIPLSKLCKLLLVFSCNYVSVLYHFRDIWCWN